MTNLLQLMTVLLLAWVAHAVYEEHENETYKWERNDDDRNFLREKKFRYCIKTGGKCGKKRPCCSRQCIDGRCVRRNTSAVGVAATSNADSYTGLLGSFAYKGKCVNLPHTADMTQLNIADCDGGNGYQQWNAKQIEQYSTTHGLIKKNNDECITVNSDPSVSQNEDPVVQTQCESMLGENPNQEWKLRGTYTCAKEGSRCDSYWVTCCGDLVCSKYGFCTNYTQPDEQCGEITQCVSGYSCKEVNGTQYTYCKEGECSTDGNRCETGCCAGLACQWENGEYYCFPRANCHGKGQESADCRHGRDKDCCAGTCSKDHPARCDCFPQGSLCWSMSDCCTVKMEINQNQACRGRKCIVEAAVGCGNECGG